MNEAIKNVLTVSAQRLEELNYLDVSMLIAVVVLQKQSSLDQTFHWQPNDGDANWPQDHFTGPLPRLGRRGAMSASAEIQLLWMIRH